MINEEYIIFSKIYPHFNEPSNPWKSLKPYLGNYLGQIEHDLELLEKLYVSMNSRIYYGQEHLLTTFLDISPLRLEEFERENSEPFDLPNHLHSKLVSADRFCFILILSPIGAGKTTFIYYNLLIEFPKRFPQIKWKPVFVNVKRLGIDINDYTNKIRNEINENISESYECFKVKNDADLTRVHKVYCKIFERELLNSGLPSKPAESVIEDLYKKQIEAFDKLKREDFGKYQKMRYTYAKKIEPAVFIILVVDNMDQHIPSHKDQMIIDAYALASSIGIPLVISLRDTSVRINEPFNILSSYRHESICLENVPQSEIIAKRFKQLSIDLRNEPKVDLNFVNILKKQFCNIDKESNFKIIFPWLSCVSNNNKRNSLETLSQVLGSKFLIKGDFKRYPQKIDDYNYTKNSIHIKKFKTAFLIGNNNYFTGDPAGIDIINLFECNKPRVQFNHIFRIKLLQFFELNKDTGQRVDNILDVLINIVGREYEDIIRETLSLFVEKGLLIIYQKNPQGVIEGLTNVYTDLNDHLEEKIYLNENGLFHIHNLIFDEIYVEEMRFSTHIQKDIFKEIFKDYKGGFKPLFKSYRQNSTVKFIQYVLKDEETFGKTFDDSLETKPIMNDVLKSYIKSCGSMFK